LVFDGHAVIPGNDPGPCCSVFGFFIWCSPVLVRTVLQRWDVWPGPAAYRYRVYL
jgi:hypothetical protein